MREIFEYVGLAIWIAGLSMMGYAGYSAYKLHKVHQLSFDVMGRTFWFRSPGNYLSGLTPNAKWVLIALGGFVVFLIGRHIRNQAMPYLKNSRDSHDPGDGDFM